ncbi:MAG: hypothetical protein BAA00_01375 [Parageobacillus thermoglucosidasius]|nr:MAG: hypothetical protein BAA00_01375 [Parageobacillus thermoglucosidasius]
MVDGYATHEESGFFITLIDINRAKVAIVYATDDRDYLGFSNDIPQSADHLHLMEELKNEKLEKEAENFVPLK